MVVSRPDLLSIGCLPPGSIVAGSSQRVAALLCPHCCVVALLPASQLCSAAPSVAALLCCSRRRSSAPPLLLVLCFDSRRPALLRLPLPVLRPALLRCLSASVSRAPPGVTPLLLSVLLRLGLRGRLGMLLCSVPGDLLCFVPLRLCSAGGCFVPRGRLLLLTPVQGLAAAIPHDGTLRNLKHRYCLDSETIGHLQRRQLP